MLLIIVAYTINDKLVGALDNGNNCVGGLLVALTSIFTLGTLVFLIMQYIWFHECAGPIVIVSYTLVFTIAFYVLVLLRTRKDASIFTSSIIASYVTFLSWSAIASLPDEECNPFVYRDDNLVT